MIEARSSRADAILLWAVRHKLPVAWRYLIATVAVAAVAIVRAQLVTSLLPWLLFVPLVTCLTLFLGFRIGAYATILAATFAAMSIAPDGRIDRLSSAQWGASLIFVAVGLLMAFLVGKLRVFFKYNLQLAEDYAHKAELLEQREAQLALVNRELGHRLKNQLAVVQAIATQTIKRSASIPAAEATVSDRLAAMGRANTLLFDYEDGAPDLKQVIDTVLAPMKVDKDRIHCTGAPVHLPRDPALAMALVIHELATNAVKYGALSDDRGHVALEWDATPLESGDLNLRFTWRESDGPHVTEPTRKGFGTLLIERSLRAHFDGDIACDYRPDGLIFSIDARVRAAGP